MKFFLTLFLAASVVLTSTYGSDLEDVQLPAHSLWKDVKSEDFAFRIAEIDMTLTIGEITNPTSKDFSHLENCAAWFLHHMQHSQNLEGLRSTLEWWDEYQETDPFENRKRTKGKAVGRSYSHLVEFNGFFFLVGTMAREDGSRTRVVGAYRWDPQWDRFFAILDTPGFTAAYGHEFRRALYTMDIP